MQSKSNIVLATAISAILGGVLNHAFDEQTPACILASPARSSASVCGAKNYPAALHVHGEPSIGLPPDPFPPLLRNAAATFFANEPVPAHRNNAQAEQSSASSVLAAACPEKEPGPLHLERSEPATYTPTGGVTVTPAAPQFVENMQPVVWPPPQRGSLVAVLTQYPTNAG